MQSGREMTVPEVLAAVESPALPWLMVTGGEPLLQVREVNALIDALAVRGRQVLVETSGAHPLGDLDPRAVRIVDVKTPGSGMAGRMAWENLDALRPQDEVKFVLTGREDYDWARQVLRRHSLDRRATVLFSAAAPHLAPETLARWILDDALPVRLNLQIHKMLNLPWDGLSSVYPTYLLATVARSSAVRDLYRPQPSSAMRFRTPSPEWSLRRTVGATVGRRRSGGAARSGAVGGTSPVESQYTRSGRR